LTILEATFDPDLNKIDAVSEKGIVGDILASRRFYRRARSVAYEDDFGKYFQTIDIRLFSAQIKSFFPTLARYKKDKLKNAISVSGSSSLSIRTRIDLLTLIGTLRDISTLLSTRPKAIFNRSLLPLDSRRDRQEIAQLEAMMLQNILAHCRKPEDNPFDADFCSRDFEAFFQSASLEIDHPDLTSSSGKPLGPFVSNDIFGIDAGRLLRQVYERIRTSSEYQSAKDKANMMCESLARAAVRTKDDEKHVTTTGDLVDYLQLELRNNGTAYFRMDSKWYSLQPAFDETLSEKYALRIGPQVKEIDFVRSWKGKDETEYNEQYDQKTNPFYLHLIKVDHIEMCDVLVVDARKKVTYIVHVKEGIGASLRDLTSQAFISARVIEEEVRTKKKDKLTKLYTQAVGNGRIDKSKVSKTKFLNYFMKNEREYCLLVHTQISKTALSAGEFASRIAKFSLVEFSSIMHANEWRFTLLRT
jgi:hypothetical protein